LRASCIVAILSGVAAIFAALATYSVVAAQPPPSHWMRVAWSESESKGTRSEMGIFKRVGEPSALVEAAYVAAATSAAAALTLFAALSVAAVYPFLGRNAFVVVLPAVLINFVVLSVGGAMVAHLVLGPVCARWVALFVGPAAFWTAANLLGVLTHVVLKIFQAYNALSVAYQWLLPRALIERLSSRAVALHQSSKVMAPGLTNRLMPGIQPLTSTSTWASKLCEAIEADFGAESFQMLLAHVQPPQAQETGARVLAELTEALPGGAPVQISGILRFLRIYLSSLISCALAYSQRQIWVTDAKKAVKRDMIVDAVQWRLVADQFDWYAAQSVHVVDVAALALAKDLTTATAFRAWLAVDTALGWCRVFPSLWEVPAARAEALADRRAVVERFASQRFDLFFQDISPTVFVQRQAFLQPVKIAQ